ncbi:daunorubicin/doxorubicin resistance ABC transporter ATP-binding protein DrrA [Streptomyces sp. CS113]|uniref:ATP-binding cassette domain-containing protein n=1 Tax=Streptomyces sp. CS113 TaxID=1982761 RepID=UPI000B41A3FA|nr:ATP-binding cassette domain-containing protein [Streptomyces sp. CS113]OWA00303.1 daunorubicin/doxorubicin resistance ABC transporter ATP-binding protein DrrA [Streptomyces sp. CS113]
MPEAIHAEGLVKHFGDVRAVDGVDLDVPQGTVLGLLGPNGAGKSTTVRILTTLLMPDAGHASVLGADVVKDPDTVRRSLGMAGQFAAVDDFLTGRENLQLIGRLYQLRKRDAAARAEELLTLFDLTDAADRTAKTYSGGMRRRLDLAAAMLMKPAVMVLDEPTSGLDPVSRRVLWDVIRAMVADGTTLLLTTQYLEEADQLADSVCVIDHGRVLAYGTSDELKARVGSDRVELVLPEGEDLTGAGLVMAAEGRGEVSVEEQARRLIVPVSNGSRSLGGIIRRLDELGVPFDDIALRRPTLDDVFIALTGRSADTGEAAGDVRVKETAK